MVWPVGDRYGVSRQPRQCMAWPGWFCRGKAVMDRHGQVCCVRVRYGKAVEAACGLAGLGLSSQGEAGNGSQGLARCGRSRCGAVGPGVAVKAGPSEVC